jgi:hypothetical protein
VGFFDHSKPAAAEVDGFAVDAGDVFALHKASQGKVKKLHFSDCRAQNYTRSFSIILLSFNGRCISPGCTHRIHFLSETRSVSSAAPEWFTIAEIATADTMKRIANSVRELSLPLQVKFLPMQAHWFILDSLLLANQANHEGMHSNALALTRQCLEAISIIELGLSSHPEAANMLSKWEADKATPGELRKWLSDSVWPSYGSGLWTEPWKDFMAHFARAIQPYAHYSSHLAKWQLRMHFPAEKEGTYTAVAEWTPRAYDPKKATRITLFHAILTYALARIWIASCGLFSADKSAWEGAREVEIS